MVLLILQCGPSTADAVASVAAVPAIPTVPYVREIDDGVDEFEMVGNDSNFQCSLRIIMCIQKMGFQQIITVPHCNPSIIIFSFV